METKNLISKSSEAPSVSSELSTFKSLKERLNLELTRLNDSLLAIVNISFSDEKIDRLSKIIINKYLGSIRNYFFWNTRISDTKGIQKRPLA